MKKYSYQDEILGHMKSLITTAYYCRNSADEESKIKIQRRYIDVRNEAIRLGLDIDNFPKKINFDSIKLIETSAEKKGRLRREELLKDNAGLRQILDEHINGYSKLLSETDYWDDEVRNITMNGLEGAYNGIEAIMENYGLDKDDEKYLLEKKREIQELGGFRE